MSDRREQLAWRVAEGAGAAERRFQRACGAEWTEAYLADWDITHEVYRLAVSPERPIQLERMRMIRRVS